MFVAGASTSSVFFWSVSFVPQIPGRFFRRQQNRIKSAPIPTAIETPRPAINDILVLWASATIIGDEGTGVNRDDVKGAYDGGGNGDSDGDGDNAETDVGEAGGLVLVEGDNTGDSDEDVGGDEGEGLPNFIGSDVGELETGMADGAGVGNAEGVAVAGLETSITSIPSTPPLVLFPPKDPRL